MLTKIGNKHNTLAPDKPLEGLILKFLSFQNTSFTLPYSAHILQACEVGSDIAAHEWATLLKIKFYQTYRLVVGARKQRKHLFKTSDESVHILQ